MISDLALHPTKCFGWGSGSGGALGRNVKLQLTPKEVDIPHKNNHSQHPIISVYAGDRITMAVTTNGEAYSWGSGPIGRKCVASKKDIPKKLQSPTFVVKCSLGVKHAACISKCENGNHRVFSFGDASDGKLGLKQKRKGIVELPTAITVGGKCIDVACGVSATNLLMENGEIVTYGLAGLGSLRMRQNAMKVARFQFQLPASVSIVSLASGASHCMALSSEGKVFAWGITQNGRLGLGQRSSEDIVNTPTCIESLWEQNIIVTNVACGSAHTALVSEDGNLFTFGWNYYYQCGGEDREQDFFVPKQLHCDWLYGSVSNIISCGFAHTATVTNSGKLYCFGFNEDGQLGIGHERNIAAPTQVKFNAQDACANSVIGVSCGNTHTVVVTSSVTKLEFQSREQKIVQRDRAKGILRKFVLWAVVQIRLQKYISYRKDKCISPAKTLCEKGVSEEGVERDNRNEHTDDALTDEESLCSFDFSPYFEQDTKSKHTSSISSISEIMAMEREDNLSKELSRRLNNERRNLQRKKLNLVEEIARRYEIYVMGREDLISTVKRSIALAGRRRRSLLNQKNQKNNLTQRCHRKRIEKKESITYTQGTNRVNEKKSVRTAKPKTQARMTKYNGNFLPKTQNRKVLSPLINRSSMLPSKNRNALLLKKRSRRLQQQEKERQQQEYEQERLRHEETAHLRKVNERNKIQAMMKVQKLKSILSVQKRNNSKMLVSLQGGLYSRERNDGSHSNAFQPKVFKSVTQWSRDFTGSS